MHLVMDTLILHEIQVTIPAPDIKARLPEWIATVVTAKCRSDSIKGILAFCGIELLEYDSGIVSKDKAGNTVVYLRSKQWMLRQPR